MKKYLFGWMVLALFGLAIQWQSCKPDDLKPAYIYVDTAYLAPSAGEGSSRAKILDAWVYANQQLLGANEMPFVIPVLAEGQTQIIMQGGIAKNGIANTRVQHPYWANYEVTLDLQPGEVDTIRPTYRYKSIAEVLVVEDFESTGTVFGADIDGDAVTGVGVTTSEAFEGNRSGIIELTTAHPYIVTGTSTFYELPRTGSAVILEFDYKCDIQFSVGIEGFFSTGDSRGVTKLTLNPKSTWNHVYIDLTGEVVSIGGLNYQLRFAAVLAQTLSSGKIYIDNVKMVYTE